MKIFTVLEREEETVQKVFKPTQSLNLVKNDDLEPVIASDVKPGNEIFLNSRTWKVKSIAFKE